MTADIVPILFYAPESMAMRLEGEMDTQIWMQGALLVRSGIDVVKTLLGLLPPRKSGRNKIPVYRLVSSDQLLLARSDRATDITDMRWPR